MEIKLIGAAIDQCAGVSGAADTPELLNKFLSNSNLSIHEIFNYSSGGQDIPELKNYYTQLATSVKNTLANKQFPLVVGGDHSCAIGTWSGVSGFLSEHKQTLGLIWIDAHMDAHTPLTTPSGNIHGMPLATLLGHGFADFLNIINNLPKLKPQNVVLIGIRSYEEAEEKLLHQLGVKIYYSHDVEKFGFAKIFAQSWQYLALQVDKIGLSIDVDGFDPAFTPGVGTCVPNGVDFNQFIYEYSRINQNKLLAVEITEANSHLDKQDKTLACVANIIKTTQQLLT